MSLQFEQRLSLDDFRRANRLHLRRTKWMVYPALLLLTLLSYGLRPWLSAPFVLLLVVLLLYLEVYLPYVAWPQRYHDNHLDQGPMVVTADEEGLSIAGPGLAWRTPWRRFRRYKEDRYTFVLYPGGNVIQIIAKGSLTEGQGTELRRLLNRFSIRVR